ncbi:MAG TPA: FAD-binding oxidoreductase [Chthoniobacterales bacterium]|nr:FAD-binding oxidoreductase [Chthoniobacterales bacterium]
MAFLSESSLRAPILPTLRSGQELPRARARAITAASADPINDLVIPPADGKVLRPGDPEFNSLLPFNLRTTVRPAVIAQCRTANGVSLALQWAQLHGFALCGHGGGHSYEGFSSCSGIMIDVRKMDAVVIDTANKTARIGAGSLLGDVAEKLFVKKFALPAGTCKPVGIAGLTLGGGHGVSSRKFGLTSDNLLSAQVVDATGAQLTASPTVNPDLFWALRGGGGGNFGIVTEFTFKVHPVNRVIAFRLVWPNNFPTSVLREWQKFALSAPDELGFVLVMSGSQGHITGIRCSGLYHPVAASQTPTVSKLRSLLSPLLSIGNPTFTTRQFTYIEAARYFAGSGDTSRVYFKGKSDYATGPLTPAGISTFISSVRNSAAPVAGIFEAYGGAINRIPAADTAFPHRGSTRFCLQYYAEWSSSSATNQRVAAVRALYAAMRPHLPGFSYVNYIDLDLTNYAAAYYKGNLPRLQAVKQQYDPGNFFHFAQSIPLPP